MRVIIALGLAEEGELLYDVTKSKCAAHGGWVQANCLRAFECGYFVMDVLTSLKSWRYRPVLLSSDWESPSDRPIRFHIPQLFKQLVGKLKQQIPTRADIQKVERVKKKVPAADRIYSDFLFTANLIKARLVDPAEMMDARKMSETSKRRLLMGAKAKKQQQQQVGSSA
ncbi:unnamed protein product [Prunus armeniaca]